MPTNLLQIAAIAQLFTIIVGVHVASAQVGRPDENRTVEQRLQRIEERLEQLEKRVDAVAKAAGLDSRSVETAPVDRLAALDQKLVLLEHNHDIEQKNLAAKAQDTPTVSAGRDGFAIASADGTYRLRVGAHFQADGKTFYDDRAHLLSDSFYVRRLRPILEGTVGKYVDFRFMPDFGNGTTAIYDAYADFKYQPYAVLRGGKFKTPLGLEQLQNDADLTFIERSLATDLVPNRDEGFEIYGNLRGRVGYTAALLNGAPVGTSVDAAKNDAKDCVGRLFLTPFSPSGPAALKGLGFGIAASTGRRDGPILPTLKTTGGQVAFFTYGSGSGTTAVTPVAAGRRLNVSPQLYFYNGPFGLMAEYVQSSQQIFALVDKSAVSRKITDDAWQITGSWLLTGDRKSFGRLTPRKGLDGGSNGKGIGAWELAFRYSELNVDSTVFAVRFADPATSAGAAREWTLGVNWYLNRNVKLTSNYAQTHFRGGAAAGNVISDRSAEKAFEHRLQVAF